MGFLRRERTRRLCLSSRGSTCYRGYQYTYSFTKQGSSYVKWLHEWKPVEDMFYTQLAIDVMRNLPQELRERLSMLSLCRSALKYRGPTRNLRLFDNDVVPVICLSLENVRLAEEKRKLLIENIVMRSQLDQNIEIRRQELKMLYGNWAATLVEAAGIDREREEWKTRAEYYRNAFDAARKIIDDTRSFAEEKFREYRGIHEVSGSNAFE